MVLLSEQERLINLEKNLINDPTSYGLSLTWGTVHDYGNIMLSAAAIVLIKFDFECGHTNINDNIWLRVKVGSSYVYGQVMHYPGAWQTVGCAVYLAPGTYDILVEGEYSGSLVAIRSFQVGTAVFNDTQASALAAYSSGIALTVPLRTTPFGPLSQATYAVQCWATTSGGYTNFENVGDNLTNGVSVLIDGVQVDWNERTQDDSANLIAGIASAKVFLPYQVGVSHTITISKRNGSTTVNISVIACPWILPFSNGSPVTLSFSQCSTLYAFLNALYTDPTKTVSVGYPHGVSFGTSTDYYNSASGTGLLTYAYTVDVPDIGSVLLFVNGMGGCVEIIGADVR